MLTSLEITDNQISGNLGNKMFLLAAMYNLAVELDDEVIIPHWQYEAYFPKVKTIERNLIWTDSLFLESNFNYSKIEVGKRNRINIKEKISRINSFSQVSLFFTNIFRILFTNKQHLNVRGYFQSEKYFIDHSALIRSQFTLDNDTRKIVNDKWEELIKGWENESIVVVQIRRKSDYDNDYHGILPMSFYNEAFKLLKGSKFLIFSDDIDWCKQNMLNDANRFVDNINPVVDMFIGAKCSHAIIANSSFSWWTAWLIENPNKTVIAPENWFGSAGMKVNETKDLYCSGWTIL